MMDIWSTHLALALPLLLAKLCRGNGCGRGRLPMTMPPPTPPPPPPLLLKKSSITRRGWRLEGTRVKAGGARPAASASFSVCLSVRLMVVVVVVVGCGLGSDMRLLGNIKVGMKASKYVNRNKQQTTRRKTKTSRRGEGNTKNRNSNSTRR